MDFRFKLFVTGSFLSRMGDHLGELGLTLILLDRFPGQLVPALGFAMSRSVITLLLGRRLGALFDRYPTRPVLLAAIALQATAMLIFATLSLLPGTPAPLFWACGALLAVGSFTYETGLTYSLLPQLGEGPHLTKLTALFHSLGQIGEVVGPVAAGLLYATWGGAGVIGADVLTFALEAIGISLIAVPWVAPAPAASLERTAAPGFWRTLSQCHPALPLIALAVGFAWCNGMSPHSAAFTFILKDHFQLDATWIGWVRTAGAISAVLGALAVTRLSRWLGGHRTTMAVGVGLEALAILAAALWRGYLPLMLGWVIVSRFGLNVFLLSATRLRQDLIPAGIRGTVNGRINAFFRGMALLYLITLTGLEYTPDAYFYLAWGTAGTIGMAALAGFAAWRRLEQPGARPAAETPLPG